MCQSKIMRLLFLPLFVVLVAAGPEVANRKLLKIGTATATGSKVTAAELKVILNVTNNFRAKYQAAKLTWSNTIAASAQAMTNTCKFAHNSAQLQKLKYGENLYMTSGSLRWSSVVSAWTSEVKYYNFKKPGFSSATGHFTQVVWRSTKQVGCGYTKCGRNIIVSCRYSPPGNYLGQFAQMVKPPLTG